MLKTGISHHKEMKLTGGKKARDLAAECAALWTMDKTQAASLSEEVQKLADSMNAESVRMELSKNRGQITVEVCGADGGKSRLTKVML